MKAPSQGNRLAEPARYPRFSIVVPAFQASGTLDETLGAIAAQTFDNWECIVVDDGSTDNTLSIATNYSNVDPRFRALHQENRGTGAAYNTGAGAAAGDFVVICSADDILLREHLARLADFIRHEPNYDIYSTNGYFLWPDGTRELIYRDAKGGVVRSWPLADVIRACFYGVGAAYRRGLLDRVGGYRSVYGEDYDFWMRAMAIGATHRYLPEPLSLFRMTQTQKSANLERVYRSDIELVTQLRDEFEFSKDERLAIDDCIRDRQSKLDALHGRRRMFRDVVRPRLKRMAGVVLGEYRALRLYRAARQLVMRDGARRPGP
jgi:glycosyltransferase involved in cell wall biosynthesis